LGVDFLSGIITFKLLWILMKKPIRRFASRGQNGNVGSGHSSSLLPITSNFTPFNAKAKLSPHAYGLSIPPVSSATATLHAGAFISLSPAHRSRLQDPRQIEM
jgi:hypothetical protein